MIARVQIPAKTFLFGEYGVLFGGATLACATGPCFTVTLESCETNSNFHEESPAGLYLQKISSKYREQIKLNWQDPFLGVGGFGGSTAEFIACYLFQRFLAGESGPLSDDEIFKCHQSYLELFPLKKPSGADLVSQLRGGFTFCSPHSQHPSKYLSLQDSWLNDVEVYLLKTPYKVATHNHLSQLDLGSLPVDDMRALSQQVQAAIEANDSNAVMELVCSYTLLMEDSRLVCDESLNVVKSLRARSDILWARGCGALGADVIAVFLEKGQIFTDLPFDDIYPLIHVNKQLVRHRTLVET